MIGKRTEEKPCSTIDTLIGNHTELTGDLTFGGGLRVDGKIRGNVMAKGDSNSMLVISEEGAVEGSIDVPHVVVNGRIDGNLISSGTVELQAKADVSGDVHYQALKMELGASVNGNLICAKKQPDRAPVASAPAEMTVTEKAS
jgi:cytoskeletal protein CcmA (bactofilin family)